MSHYYIADCEIRGIVGSMDSIDFTAGRTLVEVKDRTFEIDDICKTEYLDECDENGEDEEGGTVPYIQYKVVMEITQPEMILALPHILGKIEV